MRVMRGPVGSGKTTGCCWEIWRCASEQAPAVNGKRQTAFLVARNTYRELKDTTVASWLDWFSETRVGRFNYQDMEHRIEYGDLDCLVLFRSLDRPQDIKKILSLEITGAWFNEMREMPLSIVNRTAERVGRYPPAKDGGPTWFGMWGDTNPPDEDHWLAEFEREPPQGWEFFVQPPGLIERDGKLVTNPDAENLSNLPKGYYEINLGAMKPEEVKVYRKNEFGFVVDGKPVTPDFRPDLHVRADIKPIADLPLRIGMDVGGGTLNPSAIMFQRNRRGAYLVLAEVVCRDMGIENFGRQIKAEMADRFPDHVRQLEAGDDDAIIATGDPAGGKRDELYETVVFDHLHRACGFRVREAPSQDPKVRLDALCAPMQRHIDGLPGFMVHPRCRKLIRGLSGGWHFRRLAVSGREAFADKPDKGEYSHPCEACGYGLLDAGEMRTLQALDNDKRMKRKPPASRPGWIV
jgi:hypothetical protein